MPKKWRTVEGQRKGDQSKARENETSRRPEKRRTNEDHGKKTWSRAKNPQSNIIEENSRRSQSRARDP